MGFVMRRVERGKGSQRGLNDSLIGWVELRNAERPCIEDQRIPFSRGIKRMLKG